MTRVVLDTNVIVSGTFWTGASYRILQLVDNGKLLMFVSPEMVKEYVKVMQYDEILEKTTEEQYSAGIAAIQRLLLKATLVQPTIKVDLVKQDPDDNKVIETALAAKAQYIITNDHHLFDLKSYQNILILTPEEFMATQT